MKDYRRRHLMAKKGKMTEDETDKLLIKLNWY